MHRVTIHADLQGPADFPSWRIQVRNLLDYRRRACRWWRGVGLWLWLSKDGSVRGIVSLGAVTEEEFMDAVGRRWPVKVQPLEHEGLRETIYLHAIRPGVIFEAGQHTGGYQGIRMTVEPRKQRRLHSEDEGHLGPGSREPLPFLI
jgi:hypothetical protein